MPYTYIDAGHVDYGYTLTVHKAQGLTGDRAYVFGTDDLNAEAGYTALTRGRVENHLYIGTEHDTEIDHHAAIDDTEPLDDIRSALFRSARQTSPPGKSMGSRPSPPSVFPRLTRAPLQLPNR